MFNDAPILRKFTALAAWSLVGYLIFVTEIQTQTGTVFDMIESTWVPVLIMLAIGFVLFAPKKWAAPVLRVFGLVVLALVLYWVLM